MKIDKSQNEAVGVHGASGKCGRTRKESWEIRVRCGGHGYEGTSSVASDGAPFVIIDMMNLNRVWVDLESQVAWVEGGATLGETYHAIAESSNVHGYSAGSCPTVGIGGHIAGGGFGLLSRKYGVAADNVVDALLVDVEGRKLLDREAMGEDVFWAIRGGGGGIWGIVYAWKIKLLKVPLTVTGFIVSRPGTKQSVAKLVHQWQFVAPKLEDEFYLSLFVGAALPQTKTIGISATFNGFYLGPRREAVSILNRVFPELGIVEEDCKEMSWIESVVYFSELHNGSTISDLKDRYVRETKGILRPNQTMKGNLFTIQYLVNWKEEDNNKSEEYIDWIRGFYNSMTPYVSWGPRAAYNNYMDLDLGVMELLNTSAPPADAVEMARVWGEKYFLKNYDRLVRAKTIIDPYNVFRHQQGIPPMSSLLSVKADV
ncbi:hypothetical protein F0562_022544 [Nyssa sinensis]|uniref:FAD-binding PCMH-type domain-containing protein n=1 Tax=Nyssa sinensis TaxID=561372 RepID=A0A5J5BS36_9ASTE|nr:hypothetical protein F0562_022544 [Nyssa sinensis]